MVFDSESKKGTVHGFVNAQSHVGPYVMELVMMLMFSEDGKMVRRIDEFFDSAYYQAFIAKVEEWQASLK
jgi:hypothetical protein